MASLLPTLGGFCGGGSREGGSGGLTGGLQMAGFSADLVLLRPSASLGGRLFWKDEARFTVTPDSPLAAEQSGLFLVSSESECFS